MCRADVTPDAEGKLAEVLGAMADRLAALLGADRDRIRIGPVDFGDEPAEAPA